MFRPFKGLVHIKVNTGNDMQAAQMGGDIPGATGTTTSAPTPTTITDSGAAWTTNQWNGHMVIVGGVHGVGVGNTPTVITIDRWSTPGSPGGATATTPSSGTYVVAPGNAPGRFIALSANNTVVAAADTALTGEITTPGGGLIRKLCSYGHTTGVASYSLGGTFTANGSDVLPVNAAKIAIFNTIVGGTGQMQFEAVLSSVIPFTVSGDQGTINVTVNN